jgi:RNA polymerase sigma-70 factor (ECF subfamily)
MPGDHEPFMRAFIGAEPKMRAYAISCGLAMDQVDDLVQEAALVLWRRHADYDPSRPFLPWALGVVHHLVQDARRSRRRGQELLSPDVAGRLAKTCAVLSNTLDLQREALRRCVGKLPDGERVLLRARYAERQSLDAMARRLNKGLSAVSMALHRIRLALLQCMEREVAR